MQTIRRSSRLSVTSLAALVFSALVLFATPLSFAQTSQSGARAKGPIDVWVTLADPSVAAVGAQLAAASGEPGRGAMRRLDASAKNTLKAHKQTLRAKQDTAATALAALGARELARVNTAHNAIAVRVDPSQLAAIRALPGVLRVRPVIDYQMDLSETVPYIGAAAVQAAGFDGTGVRVAVLDSGIDYTHRNLGGLGTVAAYAAAYGANPADPKNKTRDSLFPTAKVVDGFDFVGEAWPVGALAEDPDPIDFQGHGTHVSDIIAGRSTDGTHKGVAPGASLIAVKVCSAVATSCSGIALLKGMDFALDPNGDGDLSDTADVINLSLGSSYGQPEDDLSFATDQAVGLGVVVVAAAGNSADRPYIVSSPSSASGVISVAQTQVPSAVTFALQVNSPAAIAGSYANTATVDWAPIGAGFTGDVKTALQAGGADNLACAPLPAGSLTGKVALVDRGVCSVSLKTDNAADAGAIGVLVALSAPGDAVTFSYGGGTNLVPTLVIQQILGAAIKANIAAPVNVTVSPATTIALIGGVVGSSSRGPSVGASRIKPEIGAPGASVSAVAGSGDGEEAFGGTSGASPMVAGSAALLLSAFPDRTPMQIKAMLMNSASTLVYTNPATNPGVLAPITRIGAGEVRVNRARSLGAAAWNEDEKSASLSYGAVEVDGVTNITRKLRIDNFGGTKRTYTVQNVFRYADDAANGAVEIDVPASVTVPANGKATVVVKLKVTGSKLPEWFPNGGFAGGNGSLLQHNEYDGYITFTSDGETLSVPWHVLPRGAANTQANSGQKAGSTITLNNSGADVGDFDIFALTGTSSKIPASDLPSAGDNFAVIDLNAVGVRYLADEGVLQFAVNTFGRRSHPNYPAEFDVYIDKNRDGTPEFIIFNAERSGFALTGENLVNIYNVGTGTVSAFYYNDADLNSANVIFTVPIGAVGLTPADQFDFTVYAFDNYFTGALTDAIGPMRFTAGTPRLKAAIDTGAVGTGPALKVPTTVVPGGDVASPSQSGFLIMKRRNTGSEADIVTQK